MDYDSQLLAPATSRHPRKSPSRPAMGTFGTSLAHELAAAVMSEPSESRALADELGLEFDEEEDEAHNGPEELEGHSGMMMSTNDISTLDTPSRPSRIEKLNGHGYGHEVDSDPELSPSKPPPPPSFALAPETETDPIETLKENVQFIDGFITQLQNMDLDASHSPTKPSFASQTRRTSMHGGAEPTLERIATDMIRHIDDARREREDQLRDLINCEREFRKIDGESGGADRLGSLEPLEDVLLTDKEGPGSYSQTRALDTVQEDEFDELWEAQRDPRDIFDDEDEGDDPAFADRSLRHRRVSTDRAVLPPPPPYPSGSLSPSSTLPHLAHMRAISQILASSLSGLSEHVQVNGAAAAEAGRKLRALKNKVGDLQSEWTSAEESMTRIEKGEKSPDGEGKRPDGRVIVQEISASFFAQLKQAELKVQAMFPTATVS